MSNERFKFRVWYKKDEEYLDPDYYEGFYMSPDGVVHAGITEWNGICDHYQEIPQEQLIVEQCTGLKDKNGKLIFEGDVLKVPAFFGGFVNMRVVWDDNNCRWDLHYSGKRSTAKDMTVLVLELGNASEIIGNIHKMAKGE